MAVWSENVTSRLIAESDRIDGEYFKPKYLIMQDKLKWAEPLWKYTSQIIHPSEFLRRYSKEGWSVIRAQNVRPLSMEIEGNELFLHPSIAEYLTKNQILIGDILITRTGANYGQTSLYTGEREQAVVTSHTLIIRHNSNIDPAFLALYLNTSYGRNLIDRGMYGSSQPEISPRFLKNIPVPRFTEIIENSISADVRKAYELKKNSIFLYAQAQQLLEHELGLDTLEFKKPVGYEASFSEVIDGRRIDAQCYKPEYVNYEHYLRNNCSYEHLRTLVRSTLKGKQMPPASTGSVNYVSIKDIQGIELVSNSYCALTSETRLAEKDDLLLAITGATIGKIGLNTRYERLAFCGDLLSLKVNDSIDPYYLLTVMQSPIGQSQCQRWITGSTNGHLAPHDMGKLVIPRLLITKENIISDLIRQALQTKREYQHLLEQAKRRVEELIEEAVVQ